VKINKDDNSIKPAKSIEEACGVTNCLDQNNFKDNPDTKYGPGK
jgi:hypothetical protein